MPQHLKTILGIFSLVGLIFFLDNPWGSIPPLGKFLNPHSGYPALIASDKLPHGELQFSQLQEPVEVIWDSLRIPHIFAENEHDLFFVQGYVMAFERLWQMEFQTHAAGGRLSEIIGEKALGYDRFQRRIGMTHGARQGLAELETDSLFPNLLAFTKGINAYITSLNPEDYPLEYKILDYSPEKWTPLKTCLLLKYMAWMLTGRSTDLVYTRIMNDFGIDVLADLYPQFPRDYEPIIPKKTHWDFAVIKPDPPENHYRAIADDPKFYPQPVEGIGSNNWAVHGSRTESGNPLLANDPHLGLNLPSIWYAMHLNTPDMNVMGVTIPGAPGIVLGFNDNIAWGFTNGYDDVMDWYDISFKDGNQDEYWYDGNWQPTEKVIEKIKIRNGKSFLDTITFTHHGPVVWDSPNQTAALGKNNTRNKLRQTSPGRAIRWLAHDRSNELRALYEANIATNYDEFVDALRTYTCPGQNIIYADVSGNIAIWHAGNLPIKWQGQGMLIMDGTDPQYDWQGTIPHEHKAHIINPHRGYVSSANQHPTDENYPYYMSEFYWLSYRGSQINRKLDTMVDATLEDMESLFMDNTSSKARNILPVILPMLTTNDMNADESYWELALSRWDFKYDHSSTEATFYDTWQNNLESAVWIDEFMEDNKTYIWPYFNRLDEMIRYEPDAKWFDNIHTPDKESLADLVNLSFRSTVMDLQTQLGAVDDNWQWQHFRGTNIHHLAKIPGMGRTHLPTSGGPDIVNATGLTFGPSWRFTIEMKNTLEPRGIYPGGQSGYPGSIYYDNFVDDWVVGRNHNLQFPQSSEQIQGTRLICQTH